MEDRRRHSTEADKWHLLYELSRLTELALYIVSAYYFFTPRKMFSLFVFGVACVVRLMANTAHEISHEQGCERHYGNEDSL